MSPNEILLLFLTKCDASNVILIPCLVSELFRICSHYLVGLRTSNTNVIEWQWHGKLMLYTVYYIIMV